jgi:hypothetical protein
MSSASEDIYAEDGGPDTFIDILQAFGVKTMAA